MKNKNKKSRVSGFKKTRFLELDRSPYNAGEFTPNSLSATKEEILADCSGGEEVWEIKIVKRYDVVDESVKLVEKK